MRQRRHQTPFYLLFMQHVLESLTSLVPLTFDRSQWDAEEIKVLASDRSSAPLLSGLMSPFAVLEVTGYE